MKNEKLRSILHTAWNEPRHFFFWLAMLAFSALGVLVLATAYGLPLETRPWFLIGLGLVCCFAVSALAFILAWMPPGRRFLSQLLKHRVLTLTAMATLVALFYAIENWRGWRTWHSYKRHAEARGERFDLASLVPPPVPADQNFFETPLWNDMHFAQVTNTAGRNDPSYNRIVWSDTNWGNRVVFDTTGPHSGQSPELGSWRRGQRVDLAAWQAFYRGSNNVFAATDGATTNFFPIAKEPKTPAADVLLALSKFGDNRELLVATAALPYARFWINYDAGYAALLPHLARAKQTGQYLCLHAAAARQSGDKETGVEDFKLSLRLMEVIRTEPILISHLVRISMLDTALQPVWEGLADHQWTETELRVFSAELQRLDFLQDYHLAFRGERAFNLWMMDYLRNARGKRVFEMFALMSEGPRYGWHIDFLATAAQLAPRGWFDQNKASLCRMHDTYLLPVVDRTNRMVRPTHSQRAQRVFRESPVRPYAAFFKFLLPPVDKAAVRFAHGQTMADLARVACAVERYRLANGRLPETPALLVPAFLDRLPRDVITGEPLKYRRSEDDRFLLYSVGWNGTDDGGEPSALRKDDAKDDANQDEGDWVWGSREN